MKMEDFVEAFQKDPEKASNIINSKETYRKTKYWVFVIEIVLYFGIIILALVGIESSHPVAIFSALLFGLVGIGGLLVLGILYFHIRGYELSNEDLVYHELAQAVQEYLRDSTDYGAWKNHLKNVLILLQKHENQAFAKHQEENIVTYLSYIDTRDADNVSKASFEQFYNLALDDILDNHANGFNAFLKEIEPSDVAIQRGHVSTLKTAMANIWGRPRFNLWLPIIASLVVGLSVFRFVDETLGFLITSALLAIIGLTRGEDA